MSLRCIVASAALGALLVACEHDASETGDTAAMASVPATGSAVVSALGRLEPKDGILRVTGPSRPSLVIADLLVQKGDRLKAGTPIAVLDTRDEDAARVSRAKAELTNARTELGRVEDLLRQGLVAVTVRDAAQLKADVAISELQAAEAALDKDTVRAPIDGQIVALHARRGSASAPTASPRSPTTLACMRSPKCTRPTSGA